MDSNNCKLSVYCSSSNVLIATETISQDLAIIGLTPIVKYDDKDPVPTMVSLINTTWTLLQQRQRLIDNKRDLEQKITSLTQQLLYLKHRQEQLESGLLLNEAELIEKQKILSIKTQDELDSSKKIKSLKQEIHKINEKFKYKERQMKHDYKKQQNEIASLQCKLKEILSRERGNKWKGPVDSSAERKSFTSNEDIFKKCICRLENNIQELVKENLELRKLLDSVGSEMTDLLKTQNNQESQDQISARKS